MDVYKVMKKITIHSFFMYIILVSICNTALTSNSKPKKVEITKGAPSPDSHGRVLVTNDLTSRKPVELFDCKDTIYVIVSDINSKENYELIVYWFPPYGAPPKLTNISIAAEQDAYAQLKFTPEPISRLFSAIDPSAGMEKYMGRWEVKVYMKEKLFKKRHFFVAC